MTDKVTLDLSLRPAAIINDLAALMADPSDDLDMLYVLGRLAVAVDDNIRMHAHSAAKTATWQEIGDALVISRQAAHKRFSR